MIVVATEDFEVYHAVVGELRDREVTFTTLDVGAEFPDGTTAVITAEGDALDEHAVVPDDVPVVVADPEHPRRAVDETMASLRGDEGRTVVGVDPGDRPGIAVIAGDLVVAAFQVPLRDAVEVIREEVADEPDAVVRVGDGARLKGARIVNELDDVRVELVDETGTTPYVGAGARGAGDVLAAVNIARREGEPIDHREIEPTEGELSVIKDRSREASPENREIDEALARRVASGDLSIEEALAEHRDRYSS